MIIRNLFLLLALVGIFCIFLVLSCSKNKQNSNKSSIYENKGLLEDIRKISKQGTEEFLKGEKYWYTKPK